MKPKRRAAHHPRRTYSLINELLAHPTRPIPEPKRLHQLTVMWQALRAIETEPNPTRSDWRVVSDAVNLLETLVGMGEVTDASGLLPDAVEALASAARRHLQHSATIRLSGAGIHAVRAVLEDYACALTALPERTLVRCHRLTELRIANILAGKGQAHDIEVVDL